MSYDPQTVCSDIQPQLAAYALGEVEAGDELLDHLAACDACQQDLRDYVQVARMLPSDAPDIAPPPDLRARILAAVEDEARPVAEPPIQPVAPAAAQVASAPKSNRLLRTPWGRRLATFRPAFALAVAMLVLLLGWNISLQRQISAQQNQIANSRESWQSMIVLLNDPAVHWYPVAGDTAKGHLWVAPESTVGCLVLQGLPALAADQVYQVWLRNSYEHSSGGVFEARNGNGWVMVRAGEPLENYDAVGVTIEPRGGSAAPTGPPVVQGSIAMVQAPTASGRQQAVYVVVANLPFEEVQEETRSNSTR
jgi:anti-sigma-K factor RskA